MNKNLFGLDYYIFKLQNQVEITEYKKLIQKIDSFYNPKVKLARQLFKSLDRSNLIIAIEILKNVLNNKKK